MGLLDTPPTRDQTFAVGSIIEPATLNAMSDATIGIITGTINVLHGQHERHVPALAGQIVSGVNDGTSWGDTLGQWLGAVGEVMQIPLDLRQKDRLHSVSARVLDAEQIEMRLWRVNATTGSITRTQIGTTQTSVGGGVPETLTISGLTEDVGTGFFFYYTEFVVVDDAGTSADAQVFGITYNVSHPQ